MNNSPMNLDSIRQPSPSIGNEKKERVYNAPKVGVLNVPSISRTPLGDTIALKKQENPRTVYKLTPKAKYEGFKLQTLSSAGIFVCSIGALFSLLKGKKPKVK